MNSVERVFTTLEGKQADRVPLMELAVDPGIVKQILPAVAGDRPGDIWKSMDMMAGAGLNAFGPPQPVPSMDLAAVKAHFGGEIAVVGNIDVDLLCRATTDELIAATKHLLNTASGGGGHIMSSGNSIISAVKPENYLAVVETTKRYGAYS